MRPYKKILVTITYIFAAISICSAPAFASEQQERPNPPEDFQYSILNGGAYIHFYLGSSPTVVVPEEIEGVSVRGIGDVDEYFHLAGIDGSGFECDDEYLIKKIVIPSGVQAVGEYAFTGHKGIEELVIKDGASFPMTSGKFDNATWKYDDQVFDENLVNSLRRVTLGNAMTKVDNDLFYGKNMEYITVRPGNPAYSSKDGILYNADQTKLIVCGTAYESDCVEIPDTVEEIEIGFENCTKIKKIVIPASVRSIGTTALQNCPAELVFLKDEDDSTDENNPKDENGGSDAGDNFKNEHQHLWTKRLEKATEKKDGRSYEQCSACKQIRNEKAIRAVGKLQLEKDRYIYDGTKKHPAVTVRDADGNTVPKQYYDCTYKNCKNVGQASVLVTLKENYSGQLQASFQIFPKAVSIKNITGSKKSFCVRWNAQKTQVSGYEIQYSLQKSFPKGKRKSVWIGKKQTAKKTIKKLKAKKKYYVRIRSCQMAFVDGRKTKMYSEWSKARAVKTK